MNGIEIFKYGKMTAPPSSGSGSDEDEEK